MLLAAGFRARTAALAVGLLFAALWLSLWRVPGHNLLDGFFSTLLAETISAAIVLLGPGAYSVDARLYGRREIFIPRSLPD